MIVYSDMARKFLTAKEHFSVSHKKVSWMGDVRTAALLNERGSVRESVCVVTMELVVLEVLWLAIYYMYLAYSSHYLCGWLIRCSKSNSHFTAQGAAQLPQLLFSHSSASTASILVGSERKSRFDALRPHGQAASPPPPWFLVFALHLRVDYHRKLPFAVSHPFSLTKFTT